MDSAFHDDRAVALGAALTYALLEATFGLILVLAAIVRGRIPGPWLDVVKSVSHNDVGAFVPRWLLSSTRGLQKSGKALVGIGLLADASVRAVLAVGVLRRSRLTTIAAVVFFGATAIGGLVVAGANPPVTRLFTALANAAVALVVVLEARRLRAYSRG